MGIKGLSKIITTNKIFKTVNIKELQYKKIAIDISILLYQIVISIRNSGKDITNDKGEIISHILGLFNKTIWLINNNIIPIFVFDGKPPEFKNNTIKNRKKIRSVAEEKYKESTNKKDKIKYFKRSTHITLNQINQCKELLDLMGIPYLQAEGEADILCAKLSEENVVDYVYTEDMDILTFGASKIIKNLFGKGPIVIIDKLDILKKYDLTHNEFVIFCILLGCDYHNYNFKFTTSDLINIVKNYNYFSSIKYNNKKMDGNLIELIFNYFTLKTTPINIKIKLKKPSKDLQNILINKYSLIKQKISWKINILNKKYKTLTY